MAFSLSSIVAKKISNSIKVSIVCSLHFYRNMEVVIWSLEDKCYDAPMFMSKAASCISVRMVYIICEC